MLKSKAKLTITTRLGDKGKSSLADGTRLSKSNRVFAVLGALDECNSWLGVSIAQLTLFSHEFKDSQTTSSTHRELLLAVQDCIYEISGWVARSPKVIAQEKKLVTKCQQTIDLIESAENKLEQELKPTWTHMFVYPGGCATSAWLDVARTVCRRAERELVIAQTNPTTPPVFHILLNRISDYLYLLRSWVNFKAGVSEKHFTWEK